jgi:hypothetical protein
MSLDKALKEMIKEELKKALSKMKYKIDVKILGDNETTYRIVLPFPPYIGLKLKTKVQDDFYFEGRIIDVEWEVDKQVFNVICEAY